MQGHCVGLAAARVVPIHDLLFVFVLSVWAAATSAAGVPNTPAQQPFSIADDVALADFGDLSYNGRVRALTYSPDRKLVAVNVGRGLPAENLVAGEMRIYSVEALHAFSRRRAGQPPAALWTLQYATCKSGPIIQDVRWAADSSGFGFRLKRRNGSLQLMYGDLGTHHVRSLSADEQDVTAFDLVDKDHYVYAVRSSDIWKSIPSRTEPAVDVTGLPLSQWAFPVDLYSGGVRGFDRSELWVAAGRKPEPLRDHATGAPTVLFSEGLRSLRLSRDGRWLVTVLAVERVPEEWPQRYRPRSPSFPYQITAGPQDLKTLNGFLLTGRYTLIDLRDGTSIVPVDAPTGNAAGWWSNVPPEWSADGHAVTLPNVFQQSDGHDGAVSPCAAVFELSSRTAHCVGERTEELRLGSGGTGRELTPRLGVDDPLIAVRQSATDPPVFAVRSGKNGAVWRTVWDPNPQLQSVDLGKLTVLDLTDGRGHRVAGGLYLPSVPAKNGRYPLVIQTHEFDPGTFRASGSYPSDYAARVLAADGIAVLEARCSAAPYTPDEGPCQVDLYEAAVRKLDGEGMIDPNRIGIIGFSRTCYYVLEALTRSSLQFRAATILDGVNAGYWQNLLSVDLALGLSRKEDVSLNGGEPWGAGLQSWLKSAPTFRMSQVNTPLQVFGEGVPSLVTMWEPYASLRAQGKPTELVLLNSDEHVITNPQVRVATQGRTVDWMRFWLQGYEDPDPKKATRYASWRRMRARPAGM